MSVTERVTGGRNVQRKHVSRDTLEAVDDLMRSNLDPGSPAPVEVGTFSVSGVEQMAREPSVPWFPMSDQGRRFNDYAGNWSLSDGSSLRITKREKFDLRDLGTVKYATGVVKPETDSPEMVLFDGAASNDGLHFKLLTEEGRRGHATMTVGDDGKAELTLNFRQQGGTYETQVISGAKERSRVEETVDSIVDPIRKRYGDKGLAGFVANAVSPIVETVADSFINGYKWREGRLPKWFRKAKRAGVVY